jgi:hypothetical protein
MFEEPFDAYLGYLLQLTLDLSSLDAEFERRLQTFAPAITINSASRWTLWVSRDIRQLFDQQKALLMPTRTHSAFVEFLIAFRMYLESKGCLTPFYRTKSQYSITSRPPCPPPLQIHSSARTLGHDSPSMTRNYPLMSPSEMIDDSLSYVPRSVNQWMQNFPPMYYPDSSINDQFGDSFTSLESKSSYFNHGWQSENEEYKLYDPDAYFCHPSKQLITGYSNLTLNSVHSSFEGLEMFDAPPMELLSPDVVAAAKLVSGGREEQNAAIF